jgi:tRNA dimethylallyltransferase
MTEQSQTDFHSQIQIVNSQLARLPPAILLLGPTASGKTSLALNLVRRLPLEIVSVDSALVYRGMDIGTAKPDSHMRAQIPHHLIDIIEPTERYSAGQFRSDALRVMAEINARRKIPLLVGGTMLYFKALLDGLDELPHGNSEIRAQIDARAKEAGWAALHGELQRLDPETAARLNPNDAQRIQRALELIRLTGAALSQSLGKSKPELPYRLFPIAVVPSDRSALHSGIAQRFEAMLEAGLIDEVRGLRARFDLNPDLPSMRCVGYRQVWKYLEGEYDFSTLKARGIAATRQLAKRQLTWLRSLRGLTSFDCFAPDFAQRVLAHVQVGIEASLAPARSPWPP